MIEMKTIDEIKGLCKNPQLVHNDKMCVSEISMALGLNYISTKHILNESLYKLKIAFRNVGIDMNDFETSNLDYGITKRSFANENY